MSTLDKSVNAWIYLDEDEPSGYGYQSRGSSYQSLISNGVYGCIDMLDICFFITVKQSDGTWTIAIGNADIEHGSGGGTNAQYLQWLSSDARKANPDIKLLATLGYGGSELSNIFSNTQNTPQQNAEYFAANLLAYLKQHNLDGFDVDWESPLCDSITPVQFGILFNAIRAAFNTQTGRHYFLTLSPASVGNLDAATVNKCFDFVNLQLYSGFTFASEFTSAGIEQDLLAYGAKFESNSGSDPSPYQNAQNAYLAYAKGGYNVLTQWRVNSGNFQFEQAQQMILYHLVYGSPGMQFDDTPIVGAAGNPPITQLRIFSGEILNAVQATNNDGYGGGYALPQHGDTSGSATTISLDGGDVITGVSGYTGVWYGWKCVVQLTLTTKNGKTYGPFGTMGGVTSSAAFAYQAPQGKSILAFLGSLVNVPLSGAANVNIIQSLNVSIG